MRFNVAIRTAVLRPDGSGRYDVGGGIVADSDPDQEYDEACLKARVLTELADDYGLIETFRWSASAGFVRLDLHLARMAQSARKLGFVFDPVAATTALDRLAASWGPRSGDQRVRLQLERGGSLDLTHAAVVPSKPLLTVGLSDTRLDAADPFLAHKTTRRGLYERDFEDAAAQGWDEVIFANQRGEVAEASRNTVFVEVDGLLVTPPLASGLLPGVLRRRLLECGKAVERAVPLDLLSLRPLKLGNSLHGLRDARLVSVKALSDLTTA